MTNFVDGRIILIWVLNIGYEDVDWILLTYVSPSGELT
jgi:hypothetical protein